MFTHSEITDLADLVEQRIKELERAGEKSDNLHEINTCKQSAEHYKKLYKKVTGFNFGE